MKRKIIVGSVIVIAVAILAGVLLLGRCVEHEWEVKSCTEPPVCKKCGEVAEQAGHSFNQVNGCMEPLICSVCGVEGEVPGHIWGDAEPKTCVKCGQTEAEAMVTAAPTEVPVIPVATEEPAPSKPTEIPMGDNDEYEPGEDGRIPAADTNLNNLEANEQVIIDTIIRDLAKYNQFIYDHLGYSEEEWGPGPHAKKEDPNIDILSLKNGIMEYMDFLIKYAAGETISQNAIKKAENYQPIESQIEEVRGAIFTNTPYYQDSPEKYQNYTMILKNFLEDGHPDIETIDGISLEWVDDLMMFDTRSCDVIATFTSAGETYKCYLSGTSASAEGAYYTVLDLERVE